MALITRFDWVPRDRHPEHSRTTAQYEVFEKDGATYLLVETLGSSDRAAKGTVSQSFLLDKAGMQALSKILAKAIERASG